MKFQLLGDWPINGGSMVIPVGTMIDGNVTMGDWPNDPRWRGIPLPLPMPMNAKALDQEAYDALCHWYHNEIHLLHYSPGIVPRKPTDPWPIGTRHLGPDWRL